MAETGKAAIYTRISRDKAGEGLGVARQERACRDLCERLGLEVAHVYEDNDKSATNGKPRPDYTKMLRAIAQGRFTHVVAWSNDRLQRDLEDTFRFGKVVDKAGVKVETVTSGTLEFADPDKRVGTYVMSVLADAETARRLSRIRAKHLELAQAGKPTGGLRPFGYEEDRVTIRESEAKVLRECAERVLAGEGMGSLCRDLAARGITTAHGRAWSRTTLKNVLTSYRVAGYRQHQGDLYGACWPAIVDRRTWERVRRQLDQRKRTRPARRYLLTGLLICGKCQRRMVGRPSNGEPAYTCAYANGGCGRTVRAETVETYIYGEVRGALASGELTRRIGKATSADTREAWEEVKALTADLDALAEDHGQGHITRGEWQAARDPLRARLEAAQSRLEALEARQAHPSLSLGLEAWERAWEASSTERRSAMLAGVLEGVQVGPGKPGRARFDPARFTLQWRG